ncbi:MAG: glycine--tRNA ligase subunit beta [Burkholderiales bacterium]
MQDTLLIELLTEELPPKVLPRLGQAFAEKIILDLHARQLVSAEAGFSWFATPRRLAVQVMEVRDQAPDQPFTEKLMPVAVALDAEGQPTPALLKKLETKGIPVERLAHFERRMDGKTEALFYSDVKPGARLAYVIADIVKASIKALPIPKLMRWGDTEHQFVRPVHGLVMLHGTKVLPGEVLGIESGKVTQGHRFMGAGALTIVHANHYEFILEEYGKVMPSFAKRRAEIEMRLLLAAGDAQPEEYEALLDEVTALVEWPAVYTGQFDAAFLSVPQECLILSMKQHQKYFPLLDRQGKLLPKFLVVSNLKTADPRHIIHGNERVLRARLSDAKFFFEQDQKTTLETRTPKLANVVYHNKLGTQLARVMRIQKLAAEIARRLGANADHAARAAYLCKADLLTDMVGEFPELQGVMGRYYARIDGEPEPVAQAIEAHYRPRFAGDALPADHVGAAVALADKLDTLVGIYGIGLVPSGDKDPFGLRRHALGVLRMLIEMSLPLDLMQLLQLARAQFGTEQLTDSVTMDVHGFVLERLKSYLRERDFEPDEIEAVVSQGPARIDQVLPRMEAVREFKALPEAEALAAANKRIQNILKKTEAVSQAPDLALFAEEAERALFDAVTQLAPVVHSLVANQDYTDALRALAGVRAQVDRFFDEVMVMADEPLIRNNRLALLKALGDLLNRVADISKLA